MPVAEEHMHAHPQQCLSPTLSCWQYGSHAPHALVRANAAGFFMLFCQASCTVSSAFSFASMDWSMLSGLLATCISSGRKQRVLLSALSRFTKTMAKCIALKDRKIDSGPKQSMSQASHSSILCLMEAANCATSVLPPELGHVSTCAKNSSKIWKDNCNKNLTVSFLGHCVV